MPEYQTHQTSWQGIALSVSYCPDWSPFYRDVYGYPLAHLTIRADRPLPVMSTGYRSHFTRPELIEEETGPVAFVLAWLDYEAQRPEWIVQEAEAAQLSLF